MTSFSTDRLVTRNRVVSLFILAWLLISIYLFFRHARNSALLWIVVPEWFRAIASLELQFPAEFWYALGIEFVSLLLHGIVGVLFLRLFIRLPWWVEWAAAVFIGIGLATFVLELWAIAFWLNRWTVLFTLIALIVLLLVAKQRWGWVPLDSTSSSGIAVGQPETRVETGFYWSAWSLLIGMTVLSFYHALLYPETYWDSLILYLHYGKLTYEQGGFPILYCLQVGLGLGANYPHLYPLHQAATAMLAGQWSDLYGQILATLAGLASLVVMYYTALRLFQDRLVAVFSVLCFRSIPFVCSYYVYASDYALVLFYTGLLLLVLLLFLQTPTLRSIQPLFAVAAIVPHINYLGWIVWPVVALAVGWLVARQGEYRPRWILLLLSIFGWLALASTWYARNWIVTGNPVYAFFPEIFGGKNIDLKVLESCNQEWLYHGDGAAELGDTLWTKLVISLKLFQIDWRFAPLLTGILLPSIILGWKRSQFFFYLSAAALFLLYGVYQYVISGLYWYHTIAMLPILAFFAGRFLHQIDDRFVRLGYYTLLLVASFVPGFTYSMMGPKIAECGLDAIQALLPRPGISSDLFYRYRFPDEFPFWRYINQHLEPKSVILTHDNRYHVYRDDLILIHLDDCGLTPHYGKPYVQIHQILWDTGVRYYFKIKDESTHPITVQLGHTFHLDDPRYYHPISVPLSNSTEYQLYRLVSPDANE